MYKHPHLYNRPASVRLSLARSWRASVYYAISDSLAITAGAAIAFSFSAIQQGIPFTASIVIIFTSLLLTIPIFSKFGLYNSWRGRRISDQAATLAVAWCVVFAVLIVFVVLINAIDLFDRQWAAIWFFASMTVLIGNRTIGTSTMRILRKNGWNRKRVLIVGDGRWGRKVADLASHNDWMGIDIVGFVRSGRRLPGQNIESDSVLGTYGDLAMLVEMHAIDDLWCCMPLSAIEAGDYDRITGNLEKAHGIEVGKRLITDPSEIKIQDFPVSEVMGLSVVDLGYSRMHELNKFAKDMEDKILALIALVLWSPVLAAIAIAIKVTSNGPVLFKQARHGWDGRSINIYKFRTMYTHKESDGKVTQAKKNDSRVTPVGKWLRRTSLDELPQFFNVLQGRMSIVGPRPHAIQHNKYYESQIDAYMKRHRVRPGITGWAQVNGLRGETESLEKMKKRVEYDLYYIDNWSLWFDIKIILMTLRMGFVNKNAY